MSLEALFENYTKGDRLKPSMLWKYREVIFFYLSALMNYAMADEIVESNPVQVLKLKRVDRSIRKRENYLSAGKVRELLHLIVQDARPVTLAVHLMLYSGLRKSEALNLMWSDIEDVEDVEGILCIIIRDTKNKRPHYVPVTQEIQGMLERAKNSTAYIFPSPVHKDRPISIPLQPLLLLY